MLARVLGMIGAPIIIAAFGYAPLEQRRRIRGWIARLEHIARKLLLAEAARIKPATPRAPRRRIAIRRPRTKRSASFILIPRRRTHRRRKPNPNAKPRDHARLLAARLAAVERVIANPTPYAERLARRLIRTPAQALSLAAAIACSSLIDPADAPLPVDATAAAFASALLFQDSS